MCGAARRRSAGTALLYLQPRARSDRDPGRFERPAAAGVLTTLVIVAGAPGSGKTTLARTLAAELKLPLLARDDIKEALFDSLGAVDRTASRQLGIASYLVLYRVAAQVLANGDGAIVESPFSVGLAENELMSLCKGRAAYLIHCEAPREVIQSRLSSGRPGRHPQHHDDSISLAEVLAALDEGRYGPLQLGIPTIRVSTADGYDPPVEAVTALCRLP